MKKLAAFLTALVMMAAAVSALATEVPPFSLDGTYSWGMNESEILATLAGYKIDRDREFNLTYLDPDHHRYVFEGLDCEITFGLLGDSLVLIELDFEDRVRSQSVRDALTALYGEGAPVTDPAGFADLEAMSDPDEIDLYDDDPTSYDMWTAQDGTKILMVTDVRDDEAVVIFYTVQEN